MLLLVTRALLRPAARTSIIIGGATKKSSSTMKASKPVKKFTASAAALRLQRQIADMQAEESQLHAARLALAAASATVDGAVSSSTATATPTAASTAGNLAAQGKHPRAVPTPPSKELKADQREGTSVSDKATKKRRRRHKKKSPVSSLKRRRGGRRQAGSAAENPAGASSTNLLAYLPNNDALESSIGLMLLNGRDPRATLDVTQRLLSSTVLSLAAPVQRWDPFDVKPQVFALGKYAALPIFTSIQYLEHFCDKFGFSVRGPDGAFWAEAGKAPSVPLLGFGSGADSSSSGADGGGAAGGDGGGGGALCPTSGPATRGAHDAGTRPPSTARDAGTFRASESASAFWRELRAIERFDVASAAPLHLYGAPRFHWFHGYFGDFSTVMDAATCVPGEVDVVINPCSPLELALAHRLTAKEFTDRDLLIHRAFQQVERRVRSEFYGLFRRRCPEVRAAYSCTLRRQITAEEDGEEEHHDVVVAKSSPRAFEIVILIDTSDVTGTSAAVAAAKRQGAVVGHASLRVLPLEDAPPHVRALATPFFDRSEEARLMRRGPGAAPDDDPNSNLVEMGDCVTVNSAVHPASHDVDPTIGYLEPHAIHYRQYLFDQRKFSRAPQSGDTKP